MGAYSSEGNKDKEVNIYVSIINDDANFLIYGGSLEMKQQINYVCKEKHNRSVPSFNVSRSLVAQTGQPTNGSLLIGLTS